MFISTGIVFQNTVDINGNDYDCSISSASAMNNCLQIYIFPSSVVYIYVEKCIYVCVHIDISKSAVYGTEAFWNKGDTISRRFLPN